MPRFGIYKKEESLSYTLGAFPSMELMKTHPERVKALLLHPDAQKNEGVQALTALCAERGIYTEVAPRVLQRLSAKENCYVALAFEKEMQPLCRNTDHIVLHSCQDRGNMGTILRTALGFGYTDIAIIRPSCDVFDPHVVRASMGALFHHRITVFETFAQYQQTFPEHALYMFRLQKASPLQEMTSPLPRPVSLVFGNEASGLPRELDSVGTGVRIAHSDRIDSLNLSVAASVGMYAFRLLPDAT